MSIEEKPTGAPVFRDKCGNVLGYADLIVHSTSLGRSPGLEYAKVLGVQWSKDTTWSYAESKHVHVPKLCIRSVHTDNWDSDYERRNKTPTLQKRVSVIGFGSRVLRVEREQVPEEVLALLDTVTDPEVEKALAEEEKRRKTFRIGSPKPVENGAKS